MFPIDDPRSVPSVYRSSGKVTQPRHYLMPTAAAAVIAWIGVETVAWAVPKEFNVLAIFAVLVAALVAALQVGLALLGGYWARDRGSGLVLVSLFVSGLVGYLLSSPNSVAAVLYLFILVVFAWVGFRAQTEWRYCESCDRRLEFASAPAWRLAEVGINVPTDGVLHHCPTCRRGLIEVNHRYIRQYFNGRPEYGTVRVYSQWCSPDTTQALLKPTGAEIESVPRSDRLADAIRIVFSITVLLILLYSSVPPVGALVDWGWVLIRPDRARLQWYITRHPDGSYVEEARSRLAALGDS